MDLDPDFLRRGCDHFNAGRYFDAHETWEDDWRHRQRDSPEWRLLKGLICLATALHHHGNGNEHGQMTLLQRALDALAPVESLPSPVNHRELAAYVRRALQDSDLPRREVPRVEFTPPSTDSTS